LSDVDLRSRVGTDEYRNQSRYHVVLCLEFGNLLCQFLTNLLGDFGAFDKFCCHLYPLFI